MSFRARLAGLLHRQLKARRHARNRQRHILFEPLETRSMLSIVVTVADATASEPKFDPYDVPSAIVDWAEVILHNTGQTDVQVLIGFDFEGPSPASIHDYYPSAIHDPDPANGRWGGTSCGSIADCMEVPAGATKRLYVLAEFHDWASASSDNQAMTYEPDETATLVFYTENNAAPFFSSGEYYDTTSVNITIKDKTPEVFLGMTGAPAESGSSPGYFVVWTNWDGDTNWGGSYLNVLYQLSGQATSLADYTSSGWLTIPDGQTTGTGYVTIVPTADCRDEVDYESVVLTLVGGYGSGIHYKFSNGSATHNILDGDSAPFARVGSDWEGPEPSDATSSHIASFTVGLRCSNNHSTPGYSDFPVDVAYETAPGTATPGEDYGGTSGTITFGPNDSRTASVNVPILHDLRPECDETFSFGLTGSNVDQNAYQAVATIKDNDPAPTLTVTGAAVNEAMRLVTFTVALAGNWEGTVDVTYFTIPGTASEDDFVMKSGTFTLSPLDPSQTVEVTIEDDDFDEYDESFSLQAEYQLACSSASASGIAVILDTGSDYDPNSDDPFPDLTINDVTVDEKAGKAIFTVSVSPVSGKPISVHFATAIIPGENHALFPSDFTYTEDNLVIPPYQGTRTIEVLIWDDEAVEQIEDFHVNLSSPQNVVLQDSQGRGIIVDDDEYPRPIPPTCPDCGKNGIGDFLLIGANDAGVSYSYGPPGNSNYPIRYADGVVIVGSKDIDSPGFGLPWGVTRSWTNGEGYMSTTNVMGNGWVATEQPVILPVNGMSTIALVSNSFTSRYFDLGLDGVYRPRYFMQETVVHDPGAKLFTLRDTTGAVIRFYDFSSQWAVWRRGRLESYTDPTGQQIKVISHDSDGRIVEMRRSYENGSTNGVESFLYSFVTTGLNAGLVSSVKWRKQLSGGGWTTLREAVYEYYNDEPHGNQSDLKRVTIKDGIGLIIDQTYYRYYTGEAGGFKGGLKYVFYPQSYARLNAAIGGNILTASDDVVKNYADHYFEYDSDKRATKEIAQGAGCSACANGMGAFTFSYTESNNSAGYNSWALKTVETLPDNTPDNLEDNDRNIVYTNGYGQVMLQIFQDTAANKQWATFYKYDAAGRVLMRAEPSAVTGYSEGSADLMVASGNDYQHISNSEGLVTHYTYYDGTQGASKPLGYLES